MLNDGVSVTPSAFGEQLRRTREGAGLRIEDIAAETKVSKTILNGLEEGNFRFLPERVFCRSFVAQYAKTIGVEDGPLLEAFDQAWEEYSADSGLHSNLEVLTDNLGPSIRWRFWIPIAAGVAILLVAAGVILLGSTSPREELAPDPRRSGARKVAASLPTIPVPKPSPQPIPTRTQAVNAADPTDPVDVDEDESMVSMTVEVALGAECWIHYRDRDGMTGQQLLVNGQRIALELGGPVKLTVGNAGGVKLTVGGRTYRDLGLPGQVIHTEVTRQGLDLLGSGESGT